MVMYVFLLLGYLSYVALVCIILNRRSFIDRNRARAFRISAYWEGKTDPVRHVLTDIKTKIFVEERLTGLALKIYFENYDNKKKNTVFKVYRWNTQNTIYKKTLKALQTIDAIWD